jgi:catechol 2,3-dioxygenase-like lactoylglutathione lyase family enzyme
MGMLEAAKPAIIICTKDRARAIAFYRDILGLTLAYENSFVEVFSIGGITLRVSLYGSSSSVSSRIISRGRATG